MHNKNKNMKKFFMIAYLLVLPLSTWQVFNPITGTLTVYNGADNQSGVYYNGNPSGYDGKAVEDPADSWKQPIKYITAAY